MLQLFITINTIEDCLMNDNIVQFSLSFQGNDTDRHQIDLYDVSQALIGFQRTLALTTSLMLNGELITQAPALKNAVILASPPKKGSWELMVAIATGGYFLLTAPKDTILGHLIYSAYDFIIKESLGFHPKLDESLVMQYEEFQKQKNDAKKIVPLNTARLQSLTEKCQNSIKEIHRPIYGKNTATSAVINCNIGNQIIQVGPELNMGTYGSLIGLKESNELETFEGRISSYDVNTQKGRIFIPELLRSIPFELERNSLSILDRERLIDSLKAYQRVNDTVSDIGFIKLKGYRVTNFQNDIKKLFIVDME